MTNSTCGTSASIPAGGNPPGVVMRAAHRPVARVPDVKPVVAHPSAVTKADVNPAAANLSNAIFLNARMADVCFPAGMTKVFSSAEIAAAVRALAAVERDATALACALPRPGRNPPAS